MKTELDCCATFRGDKFLVQDCRGCENIQGVPQVPPQCFGMFGKSRSRVTLSFWYPLSHQVLQGLIWEAPNRVKTKSTVLIHFGVSKESFHNCAGGIAGYIPSGVDHKNDTDPALGRKDDLGCDTLV